MPSKVQRCKIAASTMSPWIYAVLACYGNRQHYCSFTLIEIPFVHISLNLFTPQSLSRSSTEQFKTTYVLPR